jgi:hypothetical protein
MSAFVTLPAVAARMNRSRRRGIHDADNEGDLCDNLRDGTC